MQTNKRRNGNNSLQLAVIAFIAFFIFAILSVTVLFNATTVTVSGSSVYTVEQIILASGIKSGDNLVKKNTGKCSQMLTEELIYIETAKVKRVFPASFHITVVPCVEYANIQGETADKEGEVDIIDTAQWYMVSSTGKILKITQKPYHPDLIMVYGVAADDGLKLGVPFTSDDERTTETLYELLDFTKNSVMAGKIKSADISDRFNIKLNYDERITIEIGTIANIDKNMNDANEIITARLSGDAEGRLKLTGAGFSFIDKEGLTYNENVYRDNLEKSVSEELAETEDGVDETDENGVSVME